MILVMAGTSLIWECCRWNALNETTGKSKPFQKFSIPGLLNLRELGSCKRVSSTFSLAGQKLRVPWLIVKDPRVEKLGKGMLTFAYCDTRARYIVPFVLTFHKWLSGRGNSLYLSIHSSQITFIESFFTCLFGEENTVLGTYHVCRYQGCTPY